MFLEPTMSHEIRTQSEMADWIHGELALDTQLTAEQRLSECIHAKRRITA